MTGRMRGQKSGMRLGVFLHPQSRENEKENEKEIENERVVTRRRPLGELTRRKNLFVVLKMRLMKKDGPQYDAKSP